MDIQRWLNEAAEAGPPPNPGPTSTSTLFQPAEKPRPVLKGKYARKRTMSDSSLLVPQPHLKTASPSGPKLSTEKEVDTSVHSEASRPSRSVSTESESVSHRYARRPRRKTRPERYEPKQNKERGKHVHPSRKDESKNLRRKFKRKKANKSDGGVAHTFQAKNVSRDRLTLKPREHLGIFNKGKTSTAVRGRGLPDLVFSEMKFLQKEKDCPEPASQQDAPSKKRKKTHAHTKEGEISAFFTSVRPTLVEKDDNVPTEKVRADQDKIAKTVHCEREQSTKSSGVVPTIELPGKGAYLGFGGRGPRHDSTSYVSWSESVRTPDVASRRPKHPPGIDNDQQETAGHRRAGGSTSGAEDMRFKLPAPPAFHNHRRGTSTERFQISSVGTSQNRLSRSHSYPQHTSSPRKVNLVDRAAKLYSSESLASPLSMPPYISGPSKVEPERCEPGVSARPRELQEISRSATKDTARQHLRFEENGNDNELTAQETSSDLGKVIQHCNHTFRARRRATESLRSHRDLHLPRVGNGVSAYSQPTPRATAQRRPTVRFSEVETPVSEVQNFQGRSIYERQAARRHIASQEIREEEELLNDFGFHEQELMFDQNGMAYDELDFEESSDESPFYAEEFEGTDLGLEAPGVICDRVQRISTDNSIVAPGFWRPNRLY